MMTKIEFEGGEEYCTEGPQADLGTGVGYAHLAGHHIADGMVIMTFTNNAVRKVPFKRLLRITEA